jgi:hypothetical protein
MNSVIVKLPTTSSETFVALLNAPRTSNGALVPLDACRQAVADLTAAVEPCGDTQALKATELLVGSYSQHKAANPEIYARAIRSVFARYPHAVCMAAVDSLTLRLRWFPERADVFEECERHMKPLLEALSSARWMAGEHARRREEAENDAAIEASKAAFREKHGGKSPLEVLGPMFSAEEPATTKDETP